MLVDKIVELNHVEQVSTETIRQSLKNEPSALCPQTSAFLSSKIHCFICAAFGEDVNDYHVNLYRSYT